MFAITGTMTWPASELDEVRTTLAALSQTSRHEQGNIEYWWAEDVGESGTFRFLEHWESDSAFDRHCQTPHYLEFMERCLPRIQAAAASRHEISESRSLTG